MTNICFIYTDITTTGGIEKSIAVIANELCKQPEYNVKILSIKRSYNKTFFYFDEKVKIDYINKKKNGIFNNIKDIRKYLKKNKIDIVVGANIAINITVIPALFFSKIKLISWEHFNFEDSVSNKYIKLARALTVIFSDYIVVLTKNDEKKYLDKYKFLKNTKIKQIYNPIPKKNYEREFINNSKEILTVGHFLPVKGYDLLLQVVKLVLKEETEWKWIIIGDGKYKDEFKKSIRESNLEERVIIKSKVKNVEDYYKNAEIYVNTSRSEGFALTILEAKAYKLPVIAFKIPSILELLKNSENDLLIEPYNVNSMKEKIIELIENQQKREICSYMPVNNEQKLQTEYIIEQWKKLL